MGPLRGRQFLLLLLSSKPCIICGFAFIVSIPASITLAAVDNSIIGTPRLDCLEDSIEFSFKTAKQFNGRLYTKGRAEDADCRRDFFNSTNSTTTANYYVKMGHCGMTRMRSYIGYLLIAHAFLFPFGRFFIPSKNESISRRYIQRKKPLVTKRNIPTTPLGAAMTIGACSYTVRRGAIDGPTMRFAVVGDRAVHVWECEGSDSMLTLLVHSCYASDNGAKVNVPIVDDKGCAMDPVLLESIQYGANSTSAVRDHQSLRAYAVSHVYKYSDQSTISFTCNLRLCVKASGACDGISPPTCPHSTEQDNQMKRKKARARLKRDPAVSILTSDDLANTTESPIDEVIWPEVPIFNPHVHQGFDFRNIDVSTGDIFVLPKDALAEKSVRPLSDHPHSSSDSPNSLNARFVNESPPAISSGNTTSSDTNLRSSTPTTSSSDNDQHLSTRNSPTSSYPDLFDFDLFQQDHRPVGGVCIPPLTYAVMAASTLLSIIAIALFIFLRFTKAVRFLWSIGKNRHPNAKRSISKRRSFGRLRTPPAFVLYPSSLPPPAPPPPVYGRNGHSFNLTGQTRCCDKGRGMSFNAGANAGRHRSAACPEHVHSYANELYYC